MGKLLDALKLAKTPAALTALQSLNARLMSSGKALPIAENTKNVERMLEASGVKGITVNNAIQSKLDKIMVGDRAAGAQFNPVNKAINLPENTTKFIALHEAGHAVNADRLGKAAVPVAVARNLSPLAGSLINSHLASKPALAKYAPYASVLGGAPTLVEEGIATGRALNNIRKVDGTKEMLKTLPQAMSQVGGYVNSSIAIPASMQTMQKKIVELLSKGTPDAVRK